MDGWVTIGTKVDTKEFDAEIRYIENQMEEIDNKIKQADIGFEVGDTAKLEAQYEKLQNKLTSLIQKQRELNGESFTNVSQKIDKIGNSVGNVTRKVGKWALALFSVRGMYTLIRQAVSAVTEYNQQLSTDLQYIKYSVATALEPTIQFIVSLVYKLLALINAISISLFGVDLFANATAKGFNNANKSANKLKKTLAGFDEANVLNSNETTGGASGGGVSAPSIDWGKETEKQLKFVDKIKDAYNELKENFHDTQFFKDTYGNWALLFQGIAGMFVGLGEIFEGVFKIIKGIFTLNLSEIVDGVKLLLKGIVDFVSGFIETIIGILYGIVAWIYEKVILKLADVFKWLWEKIKENFSNMINGIKGGFLDAYFGIESIFISLANWFNQNVIIPIGNLFKSLWSGIKTGASNLWNGIKNIFSNVKTWVNSTVISPVKNAVDGLWSGVKKILNSMIDGINKMIKGLNKISFDVPDWVPGLGGKKWGFDIKSLPKLAKGTILNNPGKGVPVAGGTAIAGEAGREAYLPLSNTQLLEELGSTIGKYITINATILNQMNGRTISRELQQIQANKDFAMNR